MKRPPHDRVGELQETLRIPAGQADVKRVSDDVPEFLPLAFRALMHERDPAAGPLAHQQRLLMHVLNELLHGPQRERDGGKLLLEVFPQPVETALAVEQFQRRVLLRLQAIILESARVLDDGIRHTFVADLLDDKVLAHPQGNRPLRGRLHRGSGGRVLHRVRRNDPRRVFKAENASSSRATVFF
jgi:hypothetical protein